MLRQLWYRLIGPIDPPLMALAGALLFVALLVLASASPERLPSQLINITAALVIMRLVAQSPPQRLMHIALPLYLFGVLLLPFLRRGPWASYRGGNSRTPGGR